MTDDFRFPHGWLCQDIDGEIRHGEPRPSALLAGSFNPLHHGHRGLTEVASRTLGTQVAFEISIANVDKADLGQEELRQRMRQFVGLAPLYVTQAPTFAMKARLFPCAVLVVGIDTALRIIDPRYYAGDPRQRDQALDIIGDQGCRFLVAGRSVEIDRFLQLDEIEVPSPFRDLFEMIPESSFRVDVSSTQLRSRAT